ncbi:intracellular transport [Fusarium longipes]|uniref:Intracellular transport n=1 Tax=Fusarium longipes TaxID=694270 RepID=A0A395T4R1_9HYPO|nr:intracellular transport [Fusarium longipes]
MEPALATSVPGSGVTEPFASSDTRSDTKTPPGASATSAATSTSYYPVDNNADSRPSSSASSHSFQLQQESPAPAPRSPTAAHGRSQTVDVLPGSSSVPGPDSVISPSGSVQSFGGFIKRKPLSSSASAIALRFSSSGSPLPSPIDLPLPSQRFARPDSIDSPTLYEFSSASRDGPPAVQASDANLASLAATTPGTQSIPGHSPTASSSDFSDVLDGYDDLISDSKSESGPDVTRETILDGSDTEDDNDDKEDTKSQKIDSRDKDIAIAPETAEPAQPKKHPEADAQRAQSPSSDNTISNPTLAPAPMFVPKPAPPHLKLDKVTIDVANYDSSPDDPHSPSGQNTPSPQLNKPLPKSPGQNSPFASLFNWAAPSPSPSATEFSSAYSPISPSKYGAANDTVSNPQSVIQEDAASVTDILTYRNSYSSVLQSPAYAQIDEMEDELKAISAELASSIRREMDLEDLVDRLQEQINNPQAPGKRSSDYYSDSGYSSAKLSEAEPSREELEKIQRRSEQEKASIRLELTNKLQDERGRRKELDQQIKELAEKASQVDLAQMNNQDASGRLKDLETTCGDLRRRLSEERVVKNNFEDLINAIRGELHEATSERDNLRDEVVPQLRARVEGLEIEAAEYSNLTYESSKMQQELSMLRKEYDVLRGGSRSGSPTPSINRMSRAMSGGFGGGLARSNSVATSSFRGQRPSGLSRSNSVKNVQVESREALSERLKDVEAQRDALHSALKNLLDRQEFQNRENEKKIRMLQNERERLLSANPRKAGFEREISNLRTEINVLRRRAEDALEQKWQVESGLGGLKMDLDKAEQEIALLRELLEEKDILIPPSFARSSGSSTGSNSFGSTPVTSESLAKAYDQLKAAYAESLERIKELEHETGADEKTQLAVERLERTLSIAVSERDAAKHEVDSLRNQYETMSEHESKSIESERALADELNDSARRVGELASQVQQQLAANAQLRERLSNAVVRGDNDRKSNSDRIAGLQVRLKSMEEQLIAAQSASEDRVNRHEEEIAAIRDAHNAQLQRMSNNAGFSGPRSPSFQANRKPSLLSPLSPRFPGSLRSPRLSEKSFEEAAQMEVLRQRVTELEKALEDAEKEMQDVIARMSTAQIEVLTLQDEREAAVRETRRLQKLLEQEQMKSFEDRFKTLSGNV